MSDVDEIIARGRKTLDRLKNFKVEPCDPVDDDVVRKTWTPPSLQPRQPPKLDSTTNEQRAIEIMAAVVREVEARGLVGHDFISGVCDMIAEETGNAERAVRADFNAGDAELRSLVQALTERVNVLETQLADQQAQIVALSDDLDVERGGGKIAKLRSSR